MDAEEIGARIEQVKRRYHMEMFTKHVRFGNQNQNPTFLRREKKVEFLMAIMGINEPSRSIGP